MKKFYALALKITYYLSRPFTGILLHNSRRVRVLVHFQKKLLLQRTSYGHQDWSLPGGGIEKNETAIEAAVREVKEETGIVLNNNQLTCLGENRVKVGRYWPHVAMVYYVAELSRMQEPIISRPLEIIDVGWFDQESLPQKLSKTVITTQAMYYKQLRSKQ